MVNARRFNRRITVEQPRTGDGSGRDAKMYGPATTWESLGTLWASVEPLTGTEAVNGTSVIAGVAYRVSMRFRRDIDTRCRVLVPDPRGSASGLPTMSNGLHGRVLDIVSAIDEGGRHEVLVLSCKETISNG